MNELMSKTEQSPDPLHSYEILDGQTGWLDWRNKPQEWRKYRFLLQSLILRDLKARYKNSVLGILWSMLHPLGLMLVFTVIFTVLSSDNSQRQYPVFILVGIIPWNFFSGAITSGTVSVLGNASLIKKVYFPRELLPVSSLLSNLVNFLFACAVLLAFLYAFDLGLTIYALWLPVILVAQLFFTVGLVFLFSAIAVFYRDILMILEVVMTAWFFVTPIIYPFEIFGDTATVLGFTFEPARLMRWMNPMASIIDGYRTVLWGNVGSNGPVSMDPIFFIRTLVTSLIVLVVGYAIFTRMEHLFGEKL